ncbi:MAG: 4Fe-4S dicluster domain-containing protein [Armatimonadetes bacterium]|nr:4Fe-4S dicluster domain-containing protein [Armatimonadota bacterium]MDE2205945.1 4Fe-4S dicluster domain-containing protein [Armatimonadota bacterium]
MDSNAAGKLDDRLAKCIRCGFCLDACPTFRLTGKETYSPRGRIYLTRSWRENAIELDADVIDALDTCLGCRACETACPSGVEYGAILEEARAAIEESGLRPSGQSFARRELIETLTSPTRLRIALKAGRAMRSFTGGRVPGVLTRLLTGGSSAGIGLPELDASQIAPPLPELTPSIGTREYRVGIVQGCVMRVMFAGANSATARVLQRNGCDVLAPKSAACCGALHLHTGLQREARVRARRLIAAFESILPDLDAIVVNSAGCGSALKEYRQLFENEPAWRDRAARFASKVRDISEWLHHTGIRPPTGGVKGVVAVHDACHLVHGQRIRSEPREMLRAIPGISMVELEESDTCCGSAGTYNMLQPMMASELLARKMKFIREGGATVIAAGNPGCLAWIEQGAVTQGLDLTLKHPVELLDEAYRNGETGDGSGSRHIV